MWGVVEATSLDFDDDILFMEYKSFSYGFNINRSLHLGFSVEYESFSFGPIITDLLFESYKSEFVEFEGIITKNFDLGQTFVHSTVKRLVDLGPIDLCWQFIHDDKISRLMTHLLAKFEYITLLYTRAQQFENFE